MPATSIFISRAALLCCSALIFLAAVVGLCGPNSLACLAVLTSDGAMALAWIAGAAALGAVILRPIFPAVNRPLFLATAGGLGLGIFSLLALGLGLVGYLNRPVALAFPIGSSLLFLIDLVRRHPHPIDRNAMERWLRESAGASWLWLVPVVSLAIAAVTASIMPGILWKPLDPHPYDVTSYHLLVPREWYEGGRIVPLDHNVFSYFPFNVEMQFLLMMHAMGGPWVAMYACQFINVGYTCLMVLAVAGACGGGKAEHRTSNVEHPTSKFEEHEAVQCLMLNVQHSMFAFPSALSAAFAGIVPWVIMLAGVGYVESGLMLYTALSVAWALQAIRQPDGLNRNLILSGVMAGLACGVKITAVPMLLLAVPVAVGVVLLCRREVRRRKIFLACAGLVLSGSLVLSPWLIRNFAWSGNPLFPIGMSVLGHDHFTDQQVERFRIAHSPTTSERSLTGKLGVLKRDVIENWQYGYIFFPVGLLAIVLRWRSSDTWLILICGLFVFVIWIGFTHLLPRFLVMLIPVVAIAIGQIRWIRAWPIGVVVLLASAATNWAVVVPLLYVQSNPPLYQGQPRPALMGMVDLPFMLSPELIDARDRHLQIALIGDAQAFLYQIPMSQMHYRSVFDLKSGDPIDAWAGAGVKGDPNWLLVINPIEIERLHKTYAGVPDQPADWTAQEPETFYLRGDQVRKDSGSDSR